MEETSYDAHVEFYLDFVDRALADDDGIWRLLMTRFQAILDERLSDARVLDIACGEGYLSRSLARHGPREVVGVDISAALIDAAIARCDSPNLSFRVDDALQLRTFPDASLDVAVSQMAIMDIPDHRTLFSAVRRVLVPNGAFVFSLLHPCFEAPVHEPDAPRFLRDADGAPVAYLIRRYAGEGLWHSGGTGVRGRVGAYHRMLSTLLGDLLAAGFHLERLEEPRIAGGGLFGEVPQHMLIAARAR